jgi:predicted dehydrogenase
MCWLIEGGTRLDPDIQVSAPRIGVLGTGPLAREWASALARSGSGNIAVVVGGADEAAALVAEVGAPGATAVGGCMRDLLASGLAGVILAGPTAMHESLAAEALDHGLAVFCRSPLGRTEAEAGRIVDVARRADRLLMTDSPLRDAPGARRIRDLIGRGALGDVHTIELTFRVAAGPQGCAEGQSGGGWVDDPILAGGGCLLDLGTPVLDLALWALGYPEVVGASGRLFVRGQPLCGRGHVQDALRSEAEDAVAASVELSTGATIRLSCAWGAHIGCGARLKAEFHGTRGGAALVSVGGRADELRAERYRGPDTEGLGVSDECGAQSAVGERSSLSAVRWARQLAEGRVGYDPRCERAVEVAGAIDRVYARRSGMTHRPATGQIAG